MDGNFSQKCKKDPTIYGEDNHIPLIDGMWVKKEEFAGVEDAAPSREALERENNFKAAGTGKRKHNQYPVTGLFACVCPRHEIVRKLADMDSSEGFKYPTAILRTLLSGANRPHHKVMAMYDVACLYEKTYSGILTDLGYTGGGCWLCQYSMPTPTLGLARLCGTPATPSSSGALTVKLPNGSGLT